MPCIDMIPNDRMSNGHRASITASRGLAWVCAAWLVACADKPTEPQAATPLVRIGAQAPSNGPAVASVKLPPAAPARNWPEFKMQAAKRMVAANPNGTYLGAPQEVLLAIPVLEIELRADGSVKQIDVLRKPGQAPETLQLAIDAVRRAAPYGDVSKLPKPWKFAEVFLFNDDKRFKPRTLD